MSALSVLIVDDDHEIVRAIDMRLRRAGFDTHLAFDGQRGFDLAREKTPDAILMDLRMPVMDGFTMLGRLQNSVHTSRIPAVILSADPADRARLKALHAGATFFMEKPYRPDDLIQALNVAVALAQRAAASAHIASTAFQPVQDAATTHDDASAPLQQTAGMPAHDAAAPTHYAGAIPPQRVADHVHEARELLMPTQSEINVQNNRKILIADDDPAVVRALSVRCKKLGLDVETAENGLQAILKAQRSHPRLIILDINMPEADGFRVCEWLLDPQRPPVDVVMLTGRNDSDTLGRCDSFGTYYVQKNQDTWSSIKEVLTEVLDIDDQAFEAVDRTHASQIAGTELSSKSQKPTILVVDDDADLVRALSRRINKVGADVLTASNGVEAYRIAVREKPDVVIADYTMPEGGGHYLLWRLKSTEGTKHIPIIIITGQRFEPGTDSPLSRDATGRGGAVAMLRKPLNTDELFRELSQHCAIQYNPT